MADSPVENKKPKKLNHSESREQLALHILKHAEVTIDDTINEALFSGRKRNWLTINLQGCKLYLTKEKEYKTGVRTRIEISNTNQLTFLLSVSAEVTELQEADLTTVCDAIKGHKNAAKTEAEQRAELIRLLEEHGFAETTAPHASSEIWYSLGTTRVDLSRNRDRVELHLNGHNDTLRDILLGLAHGNRDEAKYLGSSSTTLQGAKKHLDLIVAAEKDQLGLGQLLMAMHEEGFIKGPRESLSVACDLIVEKGLTMVRVHAEHETPEEEEDETEEATA